MHPEILTDPSHESKLLYARLSKSDIGELIPYSELSAIIGRDVQNGARGKLNTARRMARREDRIEFGIRRGVGIVRLSDERIVTTGEDGVRRCRRMAKRANKRLGVANYDNLNRDQRAKYNTYRSVLGVIEHALGQKQMNAIEQRVYQISESIPAADALRELAGKTS